MASGSPLSENPDGRSIIGSKEGPVPIVRLFGVTNEGHSILTFVYGFTPYFYVSIPNINDINDRLMVQIRIALDQRVRISLNVVFTDPIFTLYDNVR